MYSITDCHGARQRRAFVVRSRTPSWSGQEGGVQQMTVEYKEMNERMEQRLRALQRITGMSNSTVDLDQTLDGVARLVAEELKVELCSIFVYDEVQRLLSLQATNGPRPMGDLHFTLRLGEGYSGWVADKGSPLLVYDALADPNLATEAQAYKGGYRGLLAVPVIYFGSAERLIGVISVQSLEPHEFTSDELSFVEVVAGIIAINIENGRLVVTFANEAALALENARLYEETRRGLQMKSILLRELHHRVKNNLATVAGILSLQRRRTKSAEVHSTLAESVNRVLSLAATHDLLAHEDVSEAQVEDIARQIIEAATANLKPPDKQITFVVESCPIVISSRAVTILALVLNEMISNAMKHGMADRVEGTITIRGWQEDDLVVVQVLDTGKGPPGEWSATETGASGGLGLSLITQLIGDLDGHFSLRREVIQVANDEQPEQERISTGQTACTVAEVRFPLVP
jgi:two-component system, sensor histidine kinase PdtaS